MNDRFLGAVLLVGGILAFLGYLALLFTWFEIAVIVVMVTLVGAVCFILAWIGYTLLTTPAPTQLEAPTTSSTPATGTEEKTAQPSG
ncbi:MAG: transcriptional regulator [Candidatus Bathyarchaeia archaeon]